MPRMARVVAPGYPHHLIQRGNRRQKVFFSDKDKFIYMKLLNEQSLRYGLEIWAYCLMDNHLHLIAVPKSKESFRGLAEANRRYTCIINSKNGWCGYLWQGRFASYVMDEAHCYQAIRYVENNPVRAKMVDYAQDYHFSSAKYHVLDRPDKLVAYCFWQDRIKNWKTYLCEEEGDIRPLQRHARTGRPLGSEEFITELEIFLGRIMRKQKPGRKLKTELSIVSP